MSAEIIAACRRCAAAHARRASLAFAARPRLVQAAALLLAALVSTAPASGALEPERNRDIRGLWVDHREGDQRKLAVWIEDCDGLICGRIYWLKKPLSSRGESKRDLHNPDAALRNRPLCGLPILTGFRQVDQGTWSEGRIYNPNDGRTFSSTMHMEPDGSLRIRGYVGLELLGKTVIWVRPQEPLARCG